MTTSDPVISVKNISKFFSGVCVLRDVSLDIYPGEVHCIVGENGAGKSTLIKILSGAYTPDQGVISYQGENFQHLSPKYALRNGISTIYQEIDLVPTLNATENIYLGNEPLKRGGNIDSIKMRKQAKEIIDNNISENFNLDVPVNMLTIAQQQIVVIAKALSVNAKVIIFDEPTSVFDSAEVKLLFGIISRLKSQGIAIIYISHHLNEIFEIGDRITVLRDGNLVLTGRAGEFDKKSIINAMVGRNIDLTQKFGKESNGKEILRVEGMKKKGVVNDINFIVREGEILGVAGLVGSGRTEMARLIIGADPLYQGAIYFKGKKQKIRSPRSALHLGIGMVSENRKEEGLIGMRSMSENIGYSLIEKISRFGLIPWKRINSVVKKTIADIDIRPPKPNIQVFYLSGGNQQKVALAKWLAAKCDLLILDEPTRGVDVGAKSEIYKVMQALKKEGKGILMISSDLPEILTQSDRIIVMSSGRIVGELSCNEASEAAVLSLALKL